MRGATSQMAAVASTEQSCPRHLTRRSNSTSCTAESARRRRKQGTRPAGRGEILNRRRKRRYGRKKGSAPQAPAGLLARVVNKVRDASGNVVKVKAEALFGRLKAIKRRVVELGIGATVNTSHVERLNATMRCQQARLSRHPRCVPRDERRLRWSLGAWRDLYNWARAHGSLAGRTPAMVMGLSDRVWFVLESDRYPVHVGDLMRAIWTQERETVLTSALDRQKRRKTAPTS